jgi:hypothetical protein
MLARLSIKKFPIYKRHFKCLSAIYQDVSNLGMGLAILSQNCDAAF